jgi:hypothetical protein
VSDIWLAVLSSSVVTSIVVALITGFFVLRSKQREYVNDHFKTIVARRLAAYDEIEELVNMLRNTVLGNDQAPYHQVFSSEDSWISVYALILRATAHPLWLSDDIFARVRDLNKMVFQASTNERSMIEFGQANYKAIAELREEIEILHARDMLELHRVKKFLKSKRRRLSFDSMDSRDYLT